MSARISAVIVKKNFDFSFTDITTPIDNDKIGQFSLPNITMTRTKICINMSNGMVPFLLWYRRWMELRAVLLSR